MVSDLVVGIIVVIIVGIVDHIRSTRALTRLLARARTFSPLDCRPFTLPSTAHNYYATLLSNFALSHRATCSTQRDQVTMKNNFDARVAGYDAALQERVAEVAALQKRLDAQSDYQVG